MRLFLLISLALCLFQKIYPLSISPENALKIGERIWKNECAGSLEGLTTWKEGENFASLGIGHFIWYPQDKKERFQEMFPVLLHFIESEGVILPKWLNEVKGCPWSTREDFYKNIKSPQMQQLRQFLFDTRDLQAIFMAKRLEGLLPEMILKCSPSEKDHVSTCFYKLTSDANGLYAMIDYLNFKGAGLSPTETYQGEGWGLLQVLLRIPPSSPYPLADFVKSAKEVLTRRVQHSPPERHEERWLPGWLNRLNTYMG